MKNIFKFTLPLLLVAVMFSGCDDILEPSVDQAVPTEVAVSTIGDLQGSDTGCA